jgi:hypothetical protein
MLTDFEGVLELAVRVALDEPLDNWDDGCLIISLTSVVGEKGAITIVLLVLLAILCR